jgi:hypothetical protein
MRHLRSAVAPLAALLLLLILAAPVAAGGVAVVIPAETGGRATTAGDPTTLSFQLLQHGVTPVDFGVTTVVFTDTASGESFQATATPTAKAGWFEASFTYPKGGYWAWHVDHDGLAIESAPVVVGVFETDGTMPAYWPGERSDEASFRMAAQLGNIRAERDRLQAQLDELQASTATSANALAAAESRPTMPAFVTGLLGAAIVGLLGGVALTLVAVRPRAPRVRELGVPAPAESD